MVGRHIGGRRLDFEWDEAKSERNRVIRNLPFSVAIELLDSYAIKEVDNRRDYGEIRIKALGVAKGKILVCVYTDRGDVRRIISVRDANRRERNVYRASAAIRH